MMTRLSQPTEFQPGSNSRTERLIALARGAVGWERIWPALWPASAIVGLFLAASLFNLFVPLSWPLHALVLAVSISAIGVLLYIELRQLRLPSWDDGARRLERDSRLEHRPISEANDRIAAGAGDSWAEELWRAHIRNRLARALKLRVAFPASGLARKDPRALRFVVLLLLIAGFVFAGRSALERLMAGFLSQGTGNGATIDAWIDPPAYTGEAPVYLGPATAHVAVPVGSVVNLRVHGADHAPGLSGGSDDARFGGANGEYQSTSKLTDSTTLRVRSSGRTLGSWTVTVTPDTPPLIAFAAVPSATKRGALKITYTAGDDYGVVAVRAIITPHGRHGKPLIVNLPTASLSAKTMKVTAYQDLTEHPYAGLDVDIVLEATDALGQKGRSKPVTVKLPARVFTDPLSRALIEQRQNLAAGGAVAEDRVMRTLDALTIAPDRFYQSSPGVYMGLRAAYWALKNPHREEDVEHVEQLLWQIALSLEQGGLLAAAQQLRLLQQMLAQAIAQGAPQSVIDSLLQRYEEALQRYLQSLAQNGAPSTQQAPPPGAKVLTPQDLEALLKAIQQMEQSGDREGALQMLALLQDLLENMKTAQESAGGSGGPEDKALRDAQQALGGLLGQQRSLMDKTYRQGQGAGDPRDGGASGLSKQQGGLRDQLNKILKGLNDSKNPAAKNLGDAGQSMGQSQQQLGGNDFEGSGESQKQALDSLRKAIESLAKQESQQMAGQKPGEGSNGSEDADPLGRAQGVQGGVKLPDASDLKRARGILLELRRRAGERGRPKEELDYIDRLLKQF
jgi:uncharacterized protein (TIGR02302 family)